MKVTPNIKIAGVKYTIEFVPDMRTDLECSGRVNDTMGVIQLHKGMCKDMDNATLLHEIIEAINTENEMGLAHQQIQSLATQMYQVINDNPEMFKND